MALTVLTVLVLAHLVAGQAWAEGPERVVALVVTVLIMPRFGLREWALLTFALALSAGLYLQGHGADVGLALAKGAYFTAFILAMMLLREAAATSDAVLAVGHWISRQPPGRRFATTWVGGQLAGILMNFGAVSLLAPLIQRGVRADPVTSDDEARRVVIRERRQLSALVRGFAPVIAWSPTTLTQVIILAAVPGIDPVAAIGYGLAMATVMFVIGWTEDRLRWGPPRIAPAPVAFPGRAGLHLAIVYALLIAGSIALVQGLGLSLPQALMTVAPVMLAGWVLSQNRGVVHTTAARLEEVWSVSIPRMARDAFNLGAAGFIGITAARLAPVDAIAGWAEASGVPDWMLVASLPVIITLAGQVALSPMMMVVFLGAVVSALPDLPAAPEVIGLALSAGWMLSLTGSPNATGAILISSATGLAPTTITWRWNGVYSLLALAAVVLAIWALA